MRALRLGMVSLFERFFSSSLELKRWSKDCGRGLKNGYQNSGALLSSYGEHLFSCGAALSAFRHLITFAQRRYSDFVPEAAVTWSHGGNNWNHLSIELHCPRNCVKQLPLEHSAYSYSSTLLSRNRREYLGRPSIRFQICDSECFSAFAFPFEPSFLLLAVGDLSIGLSSSGSYVFPVVALRFSGGDKARALQARRHFGDFLGQPIFCGLSMLRFRDYGVFVGSAGSLSETARICFPWPSHVSNANQAATHSCEKCVQCFRWDNCQREPYNMYSSCQLPAMPSVSRNIGIRTVHRCFLSGGRRTSVLLDLRRAPGVVELPKSVLWLHGVQKS